MKAFWAVAIAAGTGCAWQQQQAQLRSTAAGHLNCGADALTVYTRDGLGRVKGCGKEALYELEGQAWLMESVFPMNAKGVAYVPKCGSPEVIKFEDDVEDISEPVKGEKLF